MFSIISLYSSYFTSISYFYLIIMVFTIFRLSIYQVGFSEGGIREWVRLGTWPKVNSNKESYRHSIKSFLIAQRPNVYNGIWWFKKLFLTGSNLIFKDRDPTKFHNTEFVFLAGCFTYPTFVPIIAIKIVLWICTVSNDSDSIW